jgi:hypothetical protein
LYRITVTDKRAIPCGLSAVHVIIRNGKQCNLATKCIIQDDPVHEDLVKVEGQSTKRIQKKILLY